MWSRHVDSTTYPAAERRDYIEAHRPEVQREYRAVLQTAEENRRYWQERNQERFARIASSPPKPEHAEVRAKLQNYRGTGRILIP